MIPVEGDKESEENGTGQCRQRPGNTRTGEGTASSRPRVRLDTRGKSKLTPEPRSQEWMSG